MWPFRKKSEPSKSESVEQSNKENIVLAPVDLNTPITNPELKAAIAEAGNAPSENSRKVLWSKLNHANFLVIFNADGVKYTPDTTEGQIYFDCDGHIKVMTCRNPQGRQLLPVFTDGDEVSAFSAGGQVATVVMAAQQLWEFALDNLHDGAVINPGGRPLPLTREQIQNLKSTE